MLKLFTAILVCGLFLVGCGSGGGDSSNDDGQRVQLSLALIESSFPAFDDSGYTLSYFESNKEYEVQATQIAAFNTSVIQAQSYIPDGYTGYEKADVLPNISAYVSLEDSIDLYLGGTDFVNLAKDETFDSVFGDIDGDVIWVFTFKRYSDDILQSKFNTYALSILSPLGFGCQKLTGGNWSCRKKDVDNGITYQWRIGDDNKSYFYDIYK
jgi:hypothetical protein